MPEKRRLRRAYETELKKQKDAIFSIRRELECAYYNFNSETDPALTEAYIYEISALRARYDHAFQSLKNLFQ